MYRWLVDYVVGNTYKVKYVYADTSENAIKKARVKNIVDLYPIDESGNKIEIQGVR